MTIVTHWVHPDQGQLLGGPFVWATGLRPAQNGHPPSSYPAATTNTSWSGPKRSQLRSWFGVAHMALDRLQIGPRPVLTIAGAGCPADGWQHAQYSAGAERGDACGCMHPEQPVSGRCGTAPSDI